VCIADLPLLSAARDQPGRREHADFRLLFQRTQSHFFLFFYSTVIADSKRYERFWVLLLTLYRNLIGDFTNARTRVDPPPNLMLKIIAATIISTIVILLAILLIRFNRKRLHIVRCGKSAADEQLEAIYTQIERLSTEPPSCAVLARTNRRSASDDDWTIPVLSYVEPWARQVIIADPGSDVTFRLSSSTASEPILRGQVYRTLPVPRHLTKSGKARNQFSPSKYIAANPQLLAALAAVCPAYPTDLLSYLLMAGADTFEFDPMFQARVGGSPSWVQDAEFPVCDECKKRMSLILQLPGELLPGKKLPEGTFFFFGCAQHPNNTKTVAQFA